METGGLQYWLQWQVLVCALIFLPALISIRFIFTKSNTPTINTYNLWMPYWRNLHPIWLLLYRLFSFISMAYLLYLTVAEFGPFVFYFYTQWTFLLVTIYFALGTTISAHGCWMFFKEHSLSIPDQERNKFLKEDSTPLEDSTVKDNEASIKLQMHFNQAAGFWGNLMQSIYQTCAGAVVLTDIVFWCLLLPFQTGDDFKLTLLIGCMHSFNAVFLLMDSALNNLQFSWHGLVYFVLWSSAYIVFQWVMHACCLTWWPYPFLELATPWAPMWYFGITLFHLPCYGLYLLFVKAKASLFPRAFIRFLPLGFTPMAHRCNFWLPKKKRFCAIPPLHNSEFCGNHSKRSDDMWVLCSIDPSHSVLESNLEAHLKRCPLLKHKNSLSLQPFYQKGINGGDEADDHEGVTSESKRMAVHSLTAPQLIKLIEKIKYVHALISKDILDSYIVPDACRIWINRTIDRKIPFQEKHVIQQASILGNLEKLGALKSSSTEEPFHGVVSSSDSPAVVEFGAGRGYLTQMLADCYGVSKVFLIERKSYKLKADRSLRQKESLKLERLRIDIEDLNLNAIVALQGLPYLAIGKHLCGPATDMTLRCCVGEGVAKSYLTGLSIATCCHHLCQWKDYINKGFFINLGFTKDDFHAITWFTSWAVDADHGSDVLADTNMENIKNMDGVIDMTATERAVLGFMCKDIIDAGRLTWMRQSGLESELVKYVPSNVSPENHLLIAKR